MKKEIKQFFDSLEEDEKEYAENIKKFLNKISADAWCMGIDIEKVRLKDNKSMLIGELGLPKAIKVIKKPNWKKLETDYGTIKIV